MLKLACYCSDHGGVAHYRMKTPLRECAKQGLLEYRPADMVVQPVFLEKGRDEKVFAEYEETARWADLLVTQRHTTFEGGGIFRGMSAVIGGIPWVLEVDDNIVQLDPTNPAHQLYHGRTYEECYENRKVESVDNLEPGEMCFKNDATGELTAVKTTQADFLSMNYGLLRDCDAMIVSTNHLKRYYTHIRRQNGKHGNIHVCPNSLDVDLWNSIPRGPDHSPELWVGWAGGGAHVGDLELIVPIVDHILRKYRNVRFFWTRVGTPNLLKVAKKWGDRCIFVDSFCEIEDWIDFYKVLNFDIALAPLLNTTFNRGKSNLKWLEAGMMKQPCVCSKVQPYKESVKQWQDGFLCKTLKEWIRAVDLLIESKALREEVGGAAYERVLGDFSLKKNAHIWSETYQRIVDDLGPMAEERTRTLKEASDGAHISARAERDHAQPALAAVGAD